MLRRPLFASFILLSAVAMAADDPVLLRRKLAPNVTDTYSVVLKGTQTFDGPLGAQEMGSSGTMTLILKTAEVEGESANVEMTTKDVKMKLSTPMGDQEMNDVPAVVEKGKMDSRLRFTDMKAATTTQSEASAMMGMNSTGMIFIALPETAVKPGDTWEVKMPGNAMMSFEGSLKATFVGEKDGRWQLNVGGELPFKMDTSKSPNSQGIDVTGTGTMTISMDNFLDKNTGQVVKMTSKMTTKMKLNVMGQEMPASGVMESTHTLKKD